MRDFKAKKHQIRFRLGLQPISYIRVSKLKTHRPKIRFFAPQGQLVAPIHVKLGRADGHVGPLGCAKFHLNCPRGWECGPKISTISTIW